MGIRSFAGTLVGAIGMLVVAAPAAAQGATIDFSQGYQFPRFLPASAPSAAATTQTASSALAPKFDVFAGMAFWNEEGSTFSGFHVAGAYRPRRHIGFVGDVAFYAPGDGRHPGPTWMGGVRFYLPIHRVTVFAQALLGMAALDDIAFQPGVGLDVHLNRTVAIRVAADVKVSFDDDGDTYVGSRFSTGIVFGFGRR